MTAKRKRKYDKREPIEPCHARKGCQIFVSVIRKEGLTDISTAKPSFGMMPIMILSRAREAGSPVNPITAPPKDTVYPLVLLDTLNKNVHVGINGLT